MQTESSRVRRRFAGWLGISDEASGGLCWAFRRWWWCRACGIGTLRPVIWAVMSTTHGWHSWSEKGLAPGLYIARQFDNVLFDLMLLHAGNWFGFATAEKIVVAVSVLVFFWGVFALAAAVSGRAPWVLTPCFAMLAYGYSFQMGFFNYYLSIGLGCFCLALAWRLEWSGRAWDWVLVAAVAGLAYVAHPLGFLWAVATIGYLLVRKWLPGWWRLALPVAVILALRGVCGGICTDG